MENPRLANTRSNDFRYVYANGIATMFNGNEMVLVFGIKEDPSGDSKNLREEVAVVFTPTTAKSLAMTLTRVIEDFEFRSQQVIPVDEGVKQAVDKAISELTKTSPTA